VVAARAELQRAEQAEKQRKYKRKLKGAVKSVMAFKSMTRAVGAMQIKKNTDASALKSAALMQVKSAAD
jgi:hypothetical protein